MLEEHASAVHDIFLIAEFQRRVRREGLRFECSAFQEPIRLAGRIVKITDNAIKVRLCEPCYWRIELSTRVENRYQRYRPFKIDPGDESASLSDRCWERAVYALRLAWIRAKYSERRRRDSE